MKRISDNSMFLPISDEEHDVLHDLAVSITLGWHESPIFDKLIEVHYRDHFAAMSVAELGEIMDNLGCFPGRDVRRSKVRMVRALDAHFTAATREMSVGGGWL